VKTNLFFGNRLLADVSS